MASSTNWDKIRLAYVTGELSHTQIASIFGVSRSMVAKYCKREGWVAQRAQHQIEVGRETHARITELQVDESMKLYDRARNAADKLINLIESLTSDPDAFYRHAVQREQAAGGSKDKWVEDARLQTVNGKNLADVARALTSITPMVRVLDRIVEAPTQAKLDIEKEKLELDRRKAGMGDDIEHDSGIALMPAVDETLLDEAIEDPGTGA